MSDNSYCLALGSLLATQRLAESIVDHLELPQVIALQGALGAGKTQWVRFAAAALGVCPEDVTSPTYVLLQRYRGRHVIHHLDFYRLNSAAEVWDLGFDELLEQESLILVEWANKFPECLPSDHLRLEFFNAPAAPGGLDTDVSQSERISLQQQRSARLTSTGPHSQRLLLHLPGLLDHQNR